MSHSQEQHADKHEGGGTAEIKKVTIILSVLTIIELILGFWMIGFTDPTARLAIKGLIIILMMVKAFYIVAFFMHLRYEVKNLIMSVGVPLLIFVWFIGAFLWDGSSFKNLRNRYDRHFKEQASIQVPKKEEAKKHESTNTHSTTEKPEAAEKH